MPSLNSASLVVWITKFTTDSWFDARYLKDKSVLLSFFKKNYRIGSIKTPGFYFSKLVFGWGFIDIWPAWGCNWNGVLLIRSKYQNMIYKINHCAYIALCNIFFHVRRLQLPRLFRCFWNFWRLFFASRGEKNLGQKVKARIKTKKIQLKKKLRT